jgi:hypothetical protein
MLVNQLAGANGKDRLGSALEDTTSDSSAAVSDKKAQPFRAGHSSVVVDGQELVAIRPRRLQLFSQRPLRDVLPAAIAGVTVRICGCGRNCRRCTRAIRPPSGSPTSSRWHS